MTLYHSPTSPYVRKVMMVLIETDQLADVQISPAAGTPLDSTNMPLSQNPLGKIPVLTRPDGPALFDSRVICRYLDDRAGTGLYPKGEAIWASLTFEALCDGVLDAAIAMVYEKRLRSEGSHSDPVLDGYWSKIDRALASVEERWMSHLTRPKKITSITLGAALGYLDFRHSARDWRASRPELANWFTTFSVRDAFVQTAPPETA
ncbi:MAG: glutathione S-transferase [Pseudomonadota bacterium]